jgi:hypothetical protein
MFRWLVLLAFVSDSLLSLIKLFGFAGWFLFAAIGLSHGEVSFAVRAGTRNGCAASRTGRTRREASDHRDGGPLVAHAMIRLSSPSVLSAARDGALSWLGSTSRAQGHDAAIATVACQTPMVDFRPLDSWPYHTPISSTTWLFAGGSHVRVRGSRPDFKCRARLAPAKRLVGLFLSQSPRFTFAAICPSLRSGVSISFHSDWQQSSPIGNNKTVFIVSLCNR